MPTVLVNPSAIARCATSKASFRVFYAATENGIDVHLKHSVLREIFELLVQHFQLFLETSSGCTLSMLICKCSRPA